MRARGMDKGTSDVRWHKREWGQRQDAYTNYYLGEGRAGADVSNIPTRSHRVTLLQSIPLFYLMD